MLIIETLEQFADFIHNHMPMASSLLHGSVEANEELGNMSAKDAWQTACDNFVAEFIESDEVKVTLDNSICSDWIFQHSS